ncbi:hypothetical protein H8N03_06200 [Ramlibacter sp. USB13]|uniref:Uncharacterized protein n=1 Tax=Ramlibacter cellulosilyticus TaxID=2764187 RepID=A0A923MNU9_9BURK|nr:hypothetical protein [Ramlibacter cellulosilyticus]MBC5782528.1 hypothetical protein [Ramlibacter cellulosilyticus]
MGTAVQPSLLSTLVRQLPGPVLRALDAWSRRTARRRWEQRQLKWAQRKLAAAPADSTIRYHLKPWRD